MSLLDEYFAICEKNVQCVFQTIILNGSEILVNVIFVCTCHTSFLLSC